MANMQELTALVQRLVLSVASQADLIKALVRNQTVTTDSAESADSDAQPTSMTGTVELT